MPLLPAAGLDYNNILDLERRPALRQSWPVVVASAGSLLDTDVLPCRATCGDEAATLCGTHTALLQHQLELVSKARGCRRLGC